MRRQQGNVFHNRDLCRIISGFIPIVLSFDDEERDDRVHSTRVRRRGEGLPATVPYRVLSQSDEDSDGDGDDDNDDDGTHESEGNSHDEDSVVVVE